MAAAQINGAAETDTLRALSPNSRQMGYQLWISPITGYRRRGTSFADLTGLFERGLTVTSISEPLRCCASDDLVTDVRDELERLHFDVAGVRDSHSKRVTGWVARDDLTGTVCGEHARRFDPQHLVSGDTPLVDVIRALGEQERLYIVARLGVTGIVTRADLRKPPTRVLLFGLISLLEMHLTYWVQKTFPHDAWRSTLSPGRVAKVDELLARRQANRENISAVDCLQLCDKREILTKAEAARTALGLGTRAYGATTLESIERLRDRVAHSQEDFNAAGGWPELSTTVDRIEAILQASERALASEQGPATAVPPRLDAAG